MIEPTKTFNKMKALIERYRAKIKFLKVKRKKLETEVYIYQNKGKELDLALVNENIKIYKNELFKLLKNGKNKK